MSHDARRILVAVDESEESMSALTWAIDNLILPHGGDGKDFPDTLVIILHVQALPHMVVGMAGPGGYPMEDFYFEPEILESVKKNQEEISKRVLLRAKHICDTKHINCETKIVAGDARDGIRDTVEKINPTFLVVGSHGYGAIKRTFLGSVSDYCAHNAKCPVVIVKKQ